MIEANFIRCVINDILSTEEYSLPGIACYTDTPEDVIHEVIVGNNNNPSLLFSQKIIELHRSVRPTIYQAIMKNGYSRLFTVNICMRILWAVIFDTRSLL